MIFFWFENDDCGNSGEDNPFELSLSSHFLALFLFNTTWWAWWDYHTLFLKNLISLLFTLKTGRRFHLTSPIPVRSSASLLSPPPAALHYAHISADSQSWTTECRFWKTQVQNSSMIGREKEAVLQELENGFCSTTAYWRSHLRQITVSEAVSSSVKCMVRRLR